MRSTLLLCSLVGSLGLSLGVGCGGEGETSASAEASSGGASTGDASSSGEASGGVMTTDIGASTGPDGTTSAAGSESSGAGESTGEPSTTDGTTGETLDCDAVMEGPFEAELFVNGFAGSEDLAFDGKGGLALKRGEDLLIVRADKSETLLASKIPPAYGTRFLADGRLLVALPQGGAVIAVDGEGTVGKFFGGLKAPNGVYPDTEGAVWITEFGGGRLLRIAPDMTGTTIAGGALASGANGVVYDPVRRLVFYTNYQSGQIRRVALDEQALPGTPSLVTTISGASPDGLALDACGNLYVVDQGNSALLRVMVDELGQATGPATELATFPSNVANAQFGVGEGFDEHTLYLSGEPGAVYMVKVEFPGAPVATVE